MKKIIFFGVALFALAGLVGPQLADASKPVILNINCKFDDFTFQGVQANVRNTDGQLYYGIVDCKSPKLDKRYGVRNDNIISYEGEIDKIFYSIHQGTPHQTIHKCNGVIDDPETMNVRHCVFGGNELTMRLIAP